MSLLDQLTNLVEQSKEEASIQATATSQFNQVRDCAMGCAARGELNCTVELTYPDAGLKRSVAIALKQLLEAEKVSPNFNDNLSAVTINWGSML